MGSSGPFGVNITRVDTDPKFELGTEAKVPGKGTFIYAQANGDVLAYGAAKIDDDFQAAEITTTISGAEPTLVGAPQVAVTDNLYAWFFIGPGGGVGKGVKILALTLCAADVKVYTTATDACLDDSATDLVQNVKFVSTNAELSTVATEVFAVGRMTTNSQD